MDTTTAAATAMNTSTTAFDLAPGATLALRLQGVHVGLPTRMAERR